MRGGASHVTEVDAIYAVACVRDIETSAAWYSALLGREPDDRPMEGLVQWRQGDGSGLQLVADAERAGKSLITLLTPRVADARRQLARAGVALEADIAGDFGTLAQVSDPDGNRVTLAEPPRGL